MAKHMEKRARRVKRGNRTVFLELTRAGRAVLKIKMYRVYLALHQLQYSLPIITLSTSL